MIIAYSTCEQALRISLYSGHCVVVFTVYFLLAIFQVRALISWLLWLGESSIRLRVNIYKDVGDFTKEESDGCRQDLQFAYEEFTEQTTPFLFAFAYDKRVHNHMIAEQLSSDMEVMDDEEEDNIEVMNDRKKRSSSEDSKCRVRQLTVYTHSTDIVTHYARQAARRNDAVIGIPIMFNAGVCGGWCESGFRNLSTHNADYLNSLLFPNSLPGYNFKTCCVPVKYGGLNVELLAGNGPTIKTTIPSLRVTKCECLDVLA